jgi:hypothetical protein
MDKSALSLAVDEDNWRSDTIFDAASYTRINIAEEHCQGGVQRHSINTIVRQTLEILRHHERLQLEQRKGPFKTF